ncbi:MAG: hypothetical protein AB4080_04755 [Trichodesmium sp.]
MEHPYSNNLHSARQNVVLKTGDRRQETGDRRQETIILVNRSN